VVVEYNIPGTVHGIYRIYLESVWVTILAEVPTNEIIYTYILYSDLNT
jgi:hypothetical protein